VIEETVISDTKVDDIHDDDSEMIKPDKRQINDIRLGRIFCKRTLPKPVQAPIKILKTTQDESKDTFVDDNKEEDINNNVEKNLHKPTEIETVSESSLEIDIDTNSDNAQSEVVYAEF
jgi:hypothetical protein